MASHARGVAYAVKAAGMAAPDDPAAVANETRWQLDHASPAVREILGKLPPPPGNAGVLGVLINDLHEKVSAGG